MYYLLLSLKIISFVLFPQTSLPSMNFNISELVYFRIKLTAKTVDEDPASCRRWIPRKEIISAKI